MKQSKTLTDLSATKSQLSKRSEAKTKNMVGSGGVTEANAKRSKKIRRMIGDHNNEIAHLRRLIRFVEATPEEGIRMMLDQLRGQVDRITASADRYKLKEQKKEYLTRAGAQLKHTQIAELEFLLQ